MKKVLLILVLLLNLTLVRAAYFEKLPYTIIQPDGKTIDCFVTGDEYFNWIHDANGYTIIQAPDGYYYYGEQNGDLVQPSKYLVNSVDPASVGLNKWIKISKTEYESRRSGMLSYQTSISGPGYAPSTGTLNNIVVYIRFSDETEFTTTRQVYDNRLNPATGVALKSYFKEVSYNNLTISSTHYPACGLTTNLSYQDSHPRAYFQPYNATTNTIGYTGGSNGADRTAREHQLLVDAINWMNINSPVSPTLNLDGDGDGNVDNVCFIIKGSSGGWAELLWAHWWALYSQTVNLNGKRVYDYTFQPENQVSVTTLCHEMFHALGSPDLYHYYTSTDIYPVWSWDLMEAGSGHMLTYMKWKYSNYTWISTIPVITTTGTYTLNPVTSPTNNCYKIASPNSTNEYFIVEYRNKSGTFETNVPGSGLIVYRIDTRNTGNANGPPDEVYVYRPNGTPSANGTPNDAFYSSTVGRTAINDATNPNSFLQNGGSGGLNISNVTTAGTTISFNVTFPIACTPPTTQASAFTSSSITGSAMTAGWTRGNGNSVLVVASKGSAVSASPVNGMTYTANAAFGSGTQLGSGNYVVYSGTGTSVNISNLSEGSGYYFAVFEYSSTYCYKTPALTGNAITTGYCASGSSDVTYEYISNVSIGSINNLSGRGTAGYQDFTSQSTTMQIGVNTTATITATNTYSTDQVLIWVDWNKDGDFTDAGENVYTSSGSFTNPITSSSFTPPIGAFIGTTRMRIRLHDSYTGSSPNATPCGNSGYGEVEDYSINVIAACTPPAIQATSFNSSLVTNTSMTIGWTRGNGTSVLVVAKAGSAVNADPVNGNSYTANPTFGSGSEIGTDNFVVYNGTGYSSNLINLSAATDYYYSIYEYSSEKCYKKPALNGNVTTLCAEQSQEIVDYGFYFDSSVERWQEFKCTSSVLTSIDAYLYVLGLQGDLVATITDKIGTLITTKTIIEQDLQIANGWVNFAFSAPVTLNVGDIYRIKITGSKLASGANKFFWMGSTNSTYNPECVCDVSGGWPSYDYAFRTHGCSSVPINTHFVPVWWPGSGSDHMNLYALTATLDGTVLQPGDEIGIFDGNVCVGMGVLTQVLNGTVILSMVASKDDAIPPAKNGYTPGNTISYKVWDSSAGTEVNNAQASYVSGVGIYAVGATSTFNLSALTSITHNINLTSGWNIMSFAAQPTNMSMLSIVNPLITAGTLSKVQDERGNAIEQLPAPIGWVDNIGLMKVSEGYKVKVTGNTTLSITGQPVTLPHSITLDAGWNIMGYPSMSTQGALPAFNPLITAATLLKVQDEAGNAIEQLPAPIGWIDNIINLTPGHGYKVKTTINTSLIINNSAKGEYQKAEATIMRPTHFKLAYTGNGLDQMNIYLKNPSVGGVGLKTGDEIGVFDRGVCVGAGVVDDPNLKYLLVIASLDDPNTQVTDGFKEGNNFELRLWDNQAGLERNAQLVEVEKGYNKLFEKLGTSVLAVDFETVAKTSLGDAYPNPSTDKTTFTFQLERESKVRLEIYNIEGDLIKVLGDQNMAGGIHRIEWDNRAASGMRVSSGIYFYRLKLNNFIQTKQLVIN